MAQLARHRAYAAACADDFSVSHEGGVRNLRTFVNVESVRPPRQFAVMTNEPSIGDQLRAFAGQAGLSYDDIARRAGYSGRSSVQRFFATEYAPDYLPLAIANKLAKAFEETAVGRDAIIALAGVPGSNAKVVEYEGSGQQRMARDVPVYGTALGADIDFDGRAIEQTTLNTSEVIGYFQRPAILNGRSGVYGLYVQGSSMAPRFEHSDNVFVERGRSPRIGEEAVVYMRDMEDDDGERASGVMIKRLVRVTSDHVELEQFNPPATFKVERCRIVRIDRVIPFQELLS